MPLLLTPPKALPSRGTAVLSSPHEPGVQMPWQARGEKLSKGEMMAIVDERLMYDLSQMDKKGLLAILSKFPPQYTDLAHMSLCIALPGKTVINTCEALILAGIIRPYYPYLADRLENHPAILKWQGIPQAIAAATLEPTP